MQSSAMAKQFDLPAPQAEKTGIGAMDDPQANGSGPFAPTSNTMPVGGAPSVTPMPTVPTTYTGFTPKHAMEGFNFDREQNTGKSAKDAFAYLANQAPPPPLNDKAALGAWFQQYIAPGMNALGHNVSSVEGDKFRFKNWQGEFDVDYGRGAGADGGALAWQADPVGAALQEAATQQQPNAPQVAPLDVGNDATARILAEIEALMNNQTTPMQQGALSQLFGI